MVSRSQRALAIQFQSSEGLGHDRRGQLREQALLERGQAVARVHLGGQAWLAWCRKRAGVVRKLRGKMQVVVRVQAWGNRQRRGSARVHLVGKAGRGEGTGMCAGRGEEPMKVHASCGEGAGTGYLHGVARRVQAWADEWTDMS